MTAPKSLPPLRFQPARDSAFRRELRERADAYLAASATHRFADWRMHAKAAALTALAALLYLLALNAATSPGFVACYVASVVTAMVLAMNSLHDGAHSAMFRRGALNRLLTRLVSVPVGVEIGRASCRERVF